MPAAISLDLRRRIVKAYKGGHGSYAKLALIFDVSPKSVQEFVRMDKLGLLEPKPHTGGRSHQKLFEHHYQAIESWLQEDCELFWWEVAQRLEAQFQVQIDPSQLSRQMKRRGLTPKKQPTATPRRPPQKSKEGEVPGEAS